MGGAYPRRGLEAGRRQDGLLSTLSSGGRGVLVVGWHRGYFYFYSHIWVDISTPTYEAPFRQTTCSRDEFWRRRFREAVTDTALLHPGLVKDTNSGFPVGIDVGPKHAPSAKRSGDVALAVQSNDPAYPTERYADPTGLTDRLEEILG